MQQALQDTLSHYNGTMLEQLLLDWGYIALFVISFLSASILPLASAFALPILYQVGFQTWPLLGVATTGNFLGSLSTYAVGRYGGNYMIDRWLRPDPQRRARAEKLYARYGAPILFFSWMPVLGDTLTFLAGVLHGDLWRFSFWIILGKFVRYAVVLGIFNALLLLMTA
jgi:membrane protein YqaA with SNARE-associated domain